jgi:hypothetical protein
MFHAPQLGLRTLGGFMGKSLKVISGILVLFCGVMASANQLKFSSANPALYGEITVDLENNQVASFTMVLPFDGPKAQTLPVQCIMKPGTTDIFACGISKAGTPFGLFIFSSSPADKEAQFSQNLEDPSSDATGYTKQ